MMENSFENNSEQIEELEAKLKMKKRKRAIYNYLSIVICIVLAIVVLSVFILPLVSPSYVQYWIKRGADAADMLGVPLCLSFFVFGFLFAVTYSRVMFWEDKIKQLENEKAEILHQAGIVKIKEGNQNG